MEDADETLGPGAPTPRLFAGSFLRIFVASFVAHLAIFVHLHLPELLHSLGANETAIGTTSAAFSMAAILSRPIVGTLLDRRGRRVVLLSGGAMHVVASGLYATVHAMGPWVLAVRAFHGIAAGFLFSAVFTVASDVVPDERRTEAVAVFGISGILPMSLGALLGDRLLAAHDYRLVCLVSAGLALVSFALSLGVPESRPAEASGETSRFRDALLAPSLPLLWLVGILFATGLASYFVFVKSFALAAHLGNVSTFFTPYAFTAIAVRLFGSGLPERVGLERTLPPAIAILAVGLFALSAAHGETGLRVAGAFCGAGHGFAFPVLMALFVKRSGPAIRGSVISLYTAIVDVAAVVAGPFLGALADATDHRMLFRTAAACAVASVILFVAFDRRPPSHDVG